MTGGRETGWEHGRRGTGKRGWPFSSKKNGIVGIFYKYHNIKNRKLAAIETELLGEKELITACSKESRKTPKLVSFLANPR